MPGLLNVSLCFLALFSLSHAFAPSLHKPLTFQPARIVSGSVTYSLGFRNIALGMSEENNEGSDGSTDVTVTKSGTYYDDEVDPIPATKVGISETMKERLTREASAGLDSNSKQTNVILYVSVAVVVLVLLGGQGIFF